MDLKGLEDWTRQRLEAEAARRGIADPHLRTHGDLVRLILRQASAGPLRKGRVRVVEGLARKASTREDWIVATDVVAAFLPKAVRPWIRRIVHPSGAGPDGLLARGNAPQGTGAGPKSVSPRMVDDPWQPTETPRAHTTRATPPPPPPPLDEVGERPSDRSQGSPAPGASLTPSGESVVPAPDQALSAPVETAATQEVPEASFHDPPPGSADATKARAQTVGPSASSVLPAPAPSTPTASVTRPLVARWSGAGTAGASVRRPASEPGRSLMMARLLAAEGYRSEALGVYEALIARNGHDPVPRREAEIIRSGADLAGIPFPGRSPEPAEHRVQGSGSIRWDAPRQGHVELHYEVSPLGLQRAEAVLGATGELSMRLLVGRPGVVGSTAPRVEEHGPLPARGSYRLGPVSAGVPCIVALGLRDGERFVSVVHSTMPTGAQS